MDILNEITRGLAPSQEIKRARARGELVEFAEDLRAILNAHPRYRAEKATILDTGDIQAIDITVTKDDDSDFRMCLVGPVGILVHFPQGTVGTVIDFPKSGEAPCDSEPANQGEAG